MENEWNEHEHDKDYEMQDRMACQDLIYEKIMEVCRIGNVEGIWKVHMDEWKERESQDQGWKRIKIYG